jgi:hypothetical protein
MARIQVGRRVPGRRPFRADVTKDPLSELAAAPHFDRVRGLGGGELRDKAAALFDAHEPVFIDIADDPGSQGVRFMTVEQIVEQPVRVTDYAAAHSAASGTIHLAERFIEDREAQALGWHK